MSALQNFWGIPRGPLKLAWRAYGAWKKQRITRPAPPMAQPAAMALVVCCHLHGNYAMAASIWMGFHCYLRTSEITGLRKNDFVLSSDGSSIRIKTSKTIGRSGGFESVTLEGGHFIR